jgi:uncharacterized protein (DUF2141 family)
MLKILLFTSFLSFWNPNSEMVYVKIKLDNLDISKGGKIYFALYNSKDCFLKIEQATSAEVWSLEDAQKGFYYSIQKNQSYAFTLFHDQNENGKIDMTLIGLPKEGYAFSNNSMGRFGPPSFDNAKFACDSDCEQTITIRY